MPEPKPPASKRIKKPIPADLAQEVIEVAIEEVALLPKQTDSLEERARLEKKALEESRLSAEVERLKDDLERARSLHDKRIEFAYKLFSLVRWWIIAVFITVMASAVAKPYFSLSDGVLITFITSTTVSVLGLFAIAAKWLYPSNTEITKRKRGKMTEDELGL